MLRRPLCSTLFPYTTLFRSLLVFMGVVSPGFSFANFAANGWAGESTFSLTSIGGIIAAIPFAIWFFLAIEGAAIDRKSTRLNSSHMSISYAVFCLKKKKHV